MSLGEAIRRQRRWLDLTQVQLAEKVGCHPIRISDWEHGRNNSMQTRNIVALEQALELEPGALLKEYYAELAEKSRRAPQNGARSLSAQVGDENA